MEQYLYFPIRLHGLKSQKTWIFKGLELYRSDAEMWKVQLVLWINQHYCTETYGRGRSLVPLVKLGTRQREVVALRHESLTLQNC